MEGRNLSVQKKGEQALQLIIEEKALIKIINTPIDTPLPKKTNEQLESLIAGDDFFKTILAGISQESLKGSFKEEASSSSAKIDAWGGIISSLNMPESKRYVKPLLYDVDREKYVNPRLLNEAEVKDPTKIEWIDRKVNSVRGLPKQVGWRFTKKMSTSLLPSNGKMYYYQDLTVKHAVGLLFDIEQCDLKDEKYIWSDSGLTDYRWWLKSDEHHTRRKSISLNELRLFLHGYAARNEIPIHNEILACLSKDALQAVFAKSDNLIDRLNALKVQIKLHKELGRELPILIIDPEKTPRIYSTEEQLADIKIVMANNEETEEYFLLKSAISNPQDFIKQQEALLESPPSQNKIKSLFSRFFYRAEKEVISRNADNFCKKQPK